MYINIEITQWIAFKSILYKTIENIFERIKKNVLIRIHFIDPFESRILLWKTVKSYENIMNMLCSVDTPYVIWLAKEICVTNFVVVVLTMTVKLLTNVHIYLMHIFYSFFFFFFNVRAFCSEAEDRWIFSNVFNIHRFQHLSIAKRLNGITY